MRTPVVKMRNDQTEHGISTASEGGQMSMSPPFSPTTVPIQSPKEPTMTHKEHSNTLPMRETKPMDTCLADGLETPESVDTYTDETNPPEREHKQNTPVTADKQSKEKEVELVGDESQTSEQHDIDYLTLPKEQNDHTEPVQVGRHGSPPIITQPAEDTHREVRRSARENRPRPMFTYESLGQPSLQTHVEAISSQITAVPLPFIPHMTR